MASGSSSFSPSLEKTHSQGSGIKCKVSYSFTQAVGSCSTRITATFHTDYSGSVNQGITNSIQLRIGDVSQWGNVNVTATYPSADVVSVSATVIHDGNGNKTITISCGGSIACGSAQWYSVNGSKEIVLPQIPVPSVIDSANDTILRNICTVKWKPKMSDISFKVKFVLGNWSYMTPNFIYPNSTNQYTYQYTIPIDVAHQLPSSVTGTMTVILYSYTSKTDYTDYKSSMGTPYQIGSSSSKTIKVTVPDDIVPTIASSSLVMVNTNTTVNGWKIALQKYTQFRVQATANGAYSSTINSFKVTGGYSFTSNGATLSYTGEVIDKAGNFSVTIVAVDSRGRSSAASTPTAVYVYPYSFPDVTAVTADRGNATKTNVTVNASWDFYTAGDKNTATATVYYKKMTSSTWTKAGTISASGNNVSNYIRYLTGTYLVGGIEETSSYDIRVIVTDALGNSGQRDAFVATIGVTMDFRAGGKGVAVGKVSEFNMFEVAMDSLFLGTVYIRSNSTNITLEQYIKNVVKSM